MRLTRNRDRSPARQWASVVLIAVLSAGLWFGWFAWDTEYQYDAVAGRMAGPYAVWQGVGAFLCSIVVVWFAQRLLHFVVALLVIPTSFTFAWITTAASDETGLWLVGAVLVAFGTTVGSAVMLGIVAAFGSADKKVDEAAAAPE